MAFGFFKKNEYADIIFMNGKIFTQNGDFPWVTAVACKDGKVLAIGDYDELSDFENDNTEIVDLEEGYMLPGFIDTCGHPVLRTFQDTCFFLDGNNREEILLQISDYIGRNEEFETYFGYGYSGHILADLEPEEARGLLDTICNDKPLVMLEKSGFSCWLNTFALDLVKAAAEEDEMQMVTLPYLFTVLSPIDYEALQETALLLSGKYCEKGFTSVFDCGAPEYFTSVYQDLLLSLYEENMIKQRHFGSMLINRNVNASSAIHRLAQCKTNCVELNGLINFETMKLYMDDTDESNNITPEDLKNLCMAAGDNNFNIHVDALGKNAILASLDALDSVRASGYKKSALTLAHDETLGDEDKSETNLGIDIVETSSTPGDFDDPWLCIEKAENIAKAIDILTIDGAIILGIEGKCGSIEKGKNADFAVFDENPFEAGSLGSFKKLQSVMTVIGGEIVYDAEADNMSEWYSIISGQQC